MASSKNGLASRNRRDDADLVAVFERRGAVLEEADVFLVHIDVHEAADFAFFVHETFGDAGEARLQFRDGVADGGGVDFNQLLVVGQLAERRGDADFFGHKFNSIVKLLIVSGQCDLFFGLWLKFNFVAFRAQFRVFVHNSIRFYKPCHALNLVPANVNI